MKPKRKRGKVVRAWAVFLKNGKFQVAAPWKSHCGIAHACNAGSRIVKVTITFPTKEGKRK